MAEKNSHDGSCFFVQIFYNSVTFLCDNMYIYSESFENIDKAMLKAYFHAKDDSE